MIHILAPLAICRVISIWRKDDTYLISNTIYSYILYMTGRRFSYFTPSVKTRCDVSEIVVCMVRAGDITRPSPFRPLPPYCTYCHTSVPPDFSLWKSRCPSLHALLAIRSIILASHMILPHTRYDDDSQLPMAEPFLSGHGFILICTISFSG